MVNHIDTNQIQTSIQTTDPLLKLTTMALQCVLIMNEVPIGFLNNKCN